MRLVAVTAGNGHLRPVHWRASGDALHDALKTVDAAVQLRRRPDLFAEQLREAAPAETGFLVHAEHTADVRYALEPSERILHGPVQFEPLSPVPQERRFEDAELSCRIPHVA